PMSLRILPVLMWLPVPAAAGTGMGLLSFLRLPVRPAARRRLCPLLFSLLTCWALATASSAQPPPNVAPGPQRPQPDSRDEEDNVQQRELLQLLLETDAALRAQKWVE